MKRINRGTLIIIIAVTLVIAFAAVFGCFGIKGISDIRFGIDMRGGVEAVFTPKSGIEPTEGELAQARTIIEGRMDAQNILDREVTVDKASGSILVRFPWKSTETDFDPEAAISELGEMAKLTFRDEDGSVLLEGKNVKSSTAGTDTKTGKPIVSLDFDEEGARLFGKATAANVGKIIYIYMDEELLSAPTVETAIYAGKAMISGSFTPEETRALADKISAGALPYSLETKSFSTISPSLADDALGIMVTAGLLSFVCICIFMIIRYKLSGAISAVALILQVSVQLLAISIPQITLTLPGIAGIILSIGMGVDANIIINERIGDELRRGASPRSAIKSGYKNAFYSVFDGNLTTLIVAVLLVILGSGTMLSFGYTLITGIVLNFIAGIGATNLMLRSAVCYKRLNDQKLFRVTKEPKVRRFYEKRRIAFALSIAIFVIGIISALAGGVSLDAKFKGGVVLKYRCESAVDTESIETLAYNEFAVPATAFNSQELSGESHKLVVTLADRGGISPAQQAAFSDKLAAAYPDANFKLSESFSVEPFIGAKALTNAGIALGLSAVMIVLYIWLRFKKISGLSAGVMALVALLHDVFIVFTVCVVCGYPIGDSFVAVALTIIGYSINDTIVIYDRIRENKEADRRLTPPELVNVSVSQSLTRSVYTSLTTLASIAFILVLSLWNGLDSMLYFAAPMAFGLISGCYSSVCIAGPLWASWETRRAKRKEANARK